MHRKRTCQWSITLRPLAPAGCALPIRERVICEGTPQDTSCSPYTASLFYPQRRGLCWAAWYLLFSCYRVVALSALYQGAYIAIPRADRLAPYCLSIPYMSPCRAYIPSYCSLITYTHQCTHKSAHRMRIMVLEYVYTCYFCCWLFFCIMLFLLQLSHHYTYIS